MTENETLSSFDLQDYLDKHSLPGEIIALDVLTKTVVQAAVALGISEHQIVKSILFMVRDEPVLAVSAGTWTIDKKKIRKHLGASKREVRIAKDHEAHEITGYKVGSIPPLGHKQLIRTILDPSVVECHTVYGGGGDPMSMLKIESQVLIELSRAEVVRISR